MERGVAIVGVVIVAVGVEVLFAVAVDGFAHWYLSESASQASQSISELAQANNQASRGPN